MMLPPPAKYATDDMNRDFLNKFFKIRFLLKLDFSFSDFLII